MISKIEVSEYGRRVNIAITAQLKARNTSGRALARLIGRSERYVRDRIQGKLEWAIADLERICKAWGIPLRNLTSYIDVEDASLTPGHMSEIKKENTKN